MTREELYRKFGPKITEALALAILDEINILRSIAGEPDRDISQLVNAINNKLELLDNYTWMNDS